MIKPSGLWVSGIEEASIPNNRAPEQFTCLQAQLQNDWHSALIVERPNTWEISPLEIYQSHPNWVVKIVNDLFIIVSEKPNDFLFLVPSLPFSGSWPSTCLSSVYAVAPSLIRCRSKNIVGFLLLWNGTVVITKQALISCFFFFYRSLWKCIPNFWQIQKLLGITKDHSLFLTTHLLSKTKTCNQTKRKISVLIKLFDKVFYYSFYYS